MNRVCCAALAVIAGLAAVPAEAEFYLYGYTGLSFTQDNDLDISQPGLGTDLSIGGLSYEGQPFHLPPYYGGRLGYYFEAPELRPFGIEVDVLHYKMIARTDRTVGTSGSYLGAPAGGDVPLNTYVDGFEISNGVNLYALNVTAREGFLKDEDTPEGKLQLYGGAGLSAVRLVPDLFLAGQKDAIRAEDKWTGPGLDAFVGLRFLPFTVWGDTHLGLFAEYRFTHVGSTELPAPNGGTAEISAINTHHLLFGLGLQF